MRKVKALMTSPTTAGIVIKSWGIVIMIVVILTIIEMIF